MKQDKNRIYSSGDYAKLDWCIRTIQSIINLNRNEALGESYPEVLGLIGAFKKVLQDNTTVVNDEWITDPSVSDDVKNELQSYIEILEKTERSGRNGLLEDYYQDFIDMNENLKELLSHNSDLDTLVNNEQIG